MGNGASFGMVVQYPEGDDTPYDVAVYGQVSAPGEGFESPDWSKGLSMFTGFELGTGLGTIHGTFDGESVNFNVSSPWGGGAASFSQGENGDMQLNGLAYRTSGGIGVSANKSYTTSFSARDALGRIFGN